MNQSMPLKRRRDIPLVNPSEGGPQTPIGVQHRNPSSSKRRNKGNEPKIVASSSSQRQDPKNATSHTTLIRRVKAVVHIKREESDDNFAEDVSGAAKDEASDEDEVSRAIQRCSSRRSIKNPIVDDEEDEELNCFASDANLNPVWHLRRRSDIINYREEDEDEDDVDELMIGAEVNITWIGYFAFLTYNFRVMRSLAPNFQNRRYYHHPRKSVNWLHDDCLAFILDIPCIILLHVWLVFKPSVTLTVSSLVCCFLLCLHLIHQIMLYQLMSLVVPHNDSNLSIALTGMASIIWVSTITCSISMSFVNVTVLSCSRSTLCLIQVCLICTDSACINFRTCTIFSP